jgi:SAM-dependent methyltransferase
MPDRADPVLPARAAILRASLLSAAFGTLYRSRTLYWLASTIPFAGQWRVWQRRVLNRITGLEVLEIGSGIGTLFAEMVAAGYHCRAVDASPQMVAATRAELHRRGLANRDAQVLCARVQSLPFADAAFDTVVSTFPTDYIYSARSIEEIARVLRPGGRLIVVEGATLLPATVLLAPFALFQALAYGHRLAVRPASGAHMPPNAIWTDELPPRPDTIPLEAAGLRRKTERDCSRKWVVYLTIGIKPPASEVRG